MTNLYQGRPIDQLERSPEETAVYNLLDELKIQYKTLTHPSAFTMEECLEVEKQLGAKICKNLFLCNRQQTDFYLLLLPGEKIFKTKYLSGQLGCARLSFADAEAMWKYLRIRPGAASPMGLMNDSQSTVRLIIDKELLQNEDLGCHPCVNTSTLRMTMKDFLEKFLSKVQHGYTIVELPDGAAE